MGAANLGAGEHFTVAGPVVADVANMADVDLQPPGSDGFAVSPLTQRWHGNRESHAKRVRT